VRDLAEREEQADLVLGGVEPLGEGRDVRGDQDRRGLAQEGDADVCRTEDLTGQRPGGRPDLHAEDGRADLSHHLGGVESVGPAEEARQPGHPGDPRVGAAELAEVFGQLVAQDRAEGVSHRGGDRLGEGAPGGERVLDPLGPAPRERPSAARRQLGRGVEPELGDRQRLGRDAGVPCGQRRVPLGDSRLTSDVVRDVRVDRACACRREHLLDLVEDLTEHRGVVLQRRPCGEQLRVEAP
jgi:hypothetical protein